MHYAASFVRAKFSTVHENTTSHQGTTAWRSETKTSQKIRKNLLFFQQVVFYPKICWQQRLENAFLLFQRGQAYWRQLWNRATRKNSFPIKTKAAKLSKRKNMDTNLTNQNRYINIPLAWIWFVYSFISFAFLLQAQRRIWCVQEIPRKLTTTFDVDACVVLPNASHREGAPPERRIWSKRVEV